MTTPDGSPARTLGLAELADIDSPEIVSAALRRFRRRVLAWAAWIVVAAPLAYGLFLFFAWPRTGESEAMRFSKAPSGIGVGSVIEEGPVRILVLEAKRLDEQVAGLRLLVTAERLEPDERLVVGLLSGVIEIFHPERGGTGPGDPPPRPPGIDLLTEIARDKLEVLLTFEPGTERLAFDVGAMVSPLHTSPDGPPDQLPPPPTGRVMGGADEGVRLLATVRLEIPKLGIPRSIWR